MVVNGIENMDKYSLFNAGFELMPMIVSILLFICCLFDGMQKARERKLFMALVLTNFITLNLDFLAYFVDKRPDLIPINRLLMFGMYACTAVMEWLLFEYFVCLMELSEEKPIKVARKVTAVWWFVGECLLVANYFHPFLYYVDEKGSYVETKWFGISAFFQVYVALALIIIAFRYRERLKKNQILAVVLFGVSHIVLIILYISLQKIFITSGIWVLVFLGLYMLINVENANKGAVTEKELDTARKIQKNMLPKQSLDFTDVSEFDIYAVMSPAREVGGDFYDFFMLDKDHLVFLIGDVAEHGVGAALYMSVAKAVIDMRIRLGGTPAEILSSINQKIAESDDMAMSVGIWLGILNVKNGHLAFSNAGQSNPVMLEETKEGVFKTTKDEDEAPPVGTPAVGGSSVKTPPVRGSSAGTPAIRGSSTGTPPVGALSQASYMDEEIILKPGDRIFLYSDGVLDCVRKRTGENFGINRLLDILNANKNVSDEELCKKVLENISSFLEEEDSTDDITLLGFTYKGA